MGGGSRYEEHATPMLYRVFPLPCARSDCLSEGYPQPIFTDRTHNNVILAASHPRYTVQSTCIRFHDGMYSFIPLSSLRA